MDGRVPPAHPWAVEYSLVSGVVALVLGKEVVCSGGRADFDCGLADLVPLLPELSSGSVLGVWGSPVCRADRQGGLRA